MLIFFLQKERIVTNQLCGDFWDDVGVRTAQICNAHIAEKGKTNYDEECRKAEHWVVDQYLANNRERELLGPLANYDNFPQVSVVKKVADYFIARGDRNIAKSIWDRAIKVRARHYYYYLPTYLGLIDGSVKAIIVEQLDIAIAAARKTVEERRSFFLEAVEPYILLLERIGSPEERAALAKLKEEVLSGKPRERVIKKDKRKMDEAVFWDLLEETRAGAEDAVDHSQRIADRLAGFKAGEISKFNKILYTKMGEANRHDLWAVAFIIRGGCGDDAFDYFRAWLVLQGKKAFEQALANPESVSDLVEKEIDPQAEELLYAAQQAYQDVKSADLPQSAYPGAKLQGKEWKEEELPKLYPKLCKKYGFGQ